MKPVVSAFGIVDFSLTKVVLSIKSGLSFILKKMLNFKVIQLQNQHLYSFLDSEIYRIKAGSTHLKICDSCGITNLSDFCHSSW
jgi:hypothetical protein